MPVSRHAIPIIQGPRLAPLEQPLRIALEQPNAGMAGRAARQLVLMKRQAAFILEVVYHGRNQSALTVPPVRPPIEMEQTCGRRRRLAPRADRAPVNQPGVLGTPQTPATVDGPQSAYGPRRPEERSSPELGGHGTGSADQT